MEGKRTPLIEGIEGDEGQRSTWFRRVKQNFRRVPWQQHGLVAFFTVAGIGLGSAGVFFELGLVALIVGGVVAVLPALARYGSLLIISIFQRGAEGDVEDAQEGQPNQYVPPSPSPSPILLGPTFDVRRALAPSSVASLAVAVPSARGESKASSLPAPPPPPPPPPLNPEAEGQPILARPAPLPSPPPINFQLLADPSNPAPAAVVVTPPPPPAHFAAPSAPFPDPRHSVSFGAAAAAAPPPLPARSPPPLPALQPAPAVVLTPPPRHFPTPSAPPDLDPRRSVSFGAAAAPLPAAYVPDWPAPWAPSPDPRDSVSLGAQQAAVAAAAVSPPAPPQPPSAPQPSMHSPASSAPLSLAPAAQAVPAKIKSLVEAMQELLELDYPEGRNCGLTIVKCERDELVFSANFRGNPNYEALKKRLAHDGLLTLPADLGGFEGLYNFRLDPEGNPKRSFDRPGDVQYLVDGFKNSIAYTSKKRAADAKERAPSPPTARVGGGVAGGEERKPASPAAQGAPRAAAVPTALAPPPTHAASVPDPHVAAREGKRPLSGYSDGERKASPERKSPPAGDNNAQKLMGSVLKTLLDVLSLRLGDSDKAALVSGFKVGTDRTEQYITFKLKSSTDIQASLATNIGSLMVKLESVGSKLEYISTELGADRKAVDIYRLSMPAGESFANPGQVLALQYVISNLLPLVQQQALLAQARALLTAADEKGHHHHGSPYADPRLAAAPPSAAPPAPYSNFGGAGRPVGGAAAHYHAIAHMNTVILSHLAICLGLPREKFELAETAGVLSCNFYCATTPSVRNPIRSEELGRFNEALPTSKTLVAFLVSKGYVVDGLRNVSMAAVEPDKLGCAIGMGTEKTLDDLAGDLVEFIRINRLRPVGPAGGGGSSGGAPHPIGGAPPDGPATVPWTP